MGTFIMRNCSELDETTPARYSNNRLGCVLALLDL